MEQDLTKLKLKWNRLSVFDAKHLQVASCLGRQLGFNVVSTGIGMKDLPCT